jgi:hypothetical protein
MRASHSTIQGRNAELFGGSQTDTIQHALISVADEVDRLLGDKTLNHAQRVRKLAATLRQNVGQINRERGTDLLSRIPGEAIPGKFKQLPGHTAENPRLRQAYKEHDRARELASFALRNPQITRGGLFPNHPLIDAHRYFQTHADLIPKAAESIRFMGQQARLAPFGTPLKDLRRHGLNSEFDSTVGEALDKLNLNHAQAVPHVYGQLPHPLRSEIDRLATERAVAKATHDTQQKLSRAAKTVQEMERRGGFDPAELELAHRRLDDLTDYFDLIVRETAKTHQERFRNAAVAGLHLPPVEFKSLTGLMETPTGSQWLPDWLKSFSTIWKANMLAHPATQTRNALSAGIQNQLTGAVNTGVPLEGINLLRGEVSRGLAEHPDVSRLMRAQNIDETEAMRRLAAAYFPEGHSIIGDLPAGAVGHELSDITRNIPGRESIPLSAMVTEPAKAIAGYHEGKHLGWDAAKPWAIPGAFGRETPGYALANASNMVARNTEAANRIGGWMGLMKQGYSADEAAKIIGKSQVNYGGREFSAFEQDLKHLIPFYAFGSRQGQHVLNELATNPAGRLAQLVKLQNRMHAGDASLPDYVLSGTAIPLGERDDGTKTFATGLGLMHEPAVHTLGALAHGDLKSAGLDLLAMLNPLVRAPLEHATGQSFYQRGEPVGNLDPNIGRLLSNLGVYAGLRGEHAGPMEFPGSSVVEPLVAASPLSRMVGTAKGLTDTRKKGLVGALEKAANATTGLRITDVSPAKQHATLLRRAQELAKKAGGKAREDVYFSKAQLERLKETDPALYARQKALQKMLNQLNARAGAAKQKKEQTGDFKLSRVKK